VIQDILVAAGGPTASLLITLLFFLLALFLPADSASQTWLIWTGLLSSALAILNLIPFPGLDGGHLLLLSGSLLGLDLSPQRELAIHRAGTRLLTGLSGLLLLLSLIDRG